MEKVSIEQLQHILENSKLLKTYLQLFTDAKKETVVETVMQVVRENYEKSTIGVRMINTLLHQYFIEGGIKEKEAKKTTFQKTLSLA